MAGRLVGVGLALAIVSLLGGCGGPPAVSGVPGNATTTTPAPKLVGLHPPGNFTRSGTCGSRATACFVSATVAVPTTQQAASQLLTEVAPHVQVLSVVCTGTPPEPAPSTYQETCQGDIVIGKVPVSFLLSAKRIADGGPGSGTTIDLISGREVPLSG